MPSVFIEIETRTKERKKEMIKIKKQAMRERSKKLKKGRKEESQGLIMVPRSRNTKDHADASTQS